MVQGLALGIAEGLASVTLSQAVFREGGEGRLPLGLAGRRTGTQFPRGV